jgi:hypothetical protein
MATKSPAKKATPKKEAAKAAPAKTVVQTAPAKAAPARKPAAKKPLKAGSKLRCGVCGIVVSVETLCGCTEVCDLVCCEAPMIPQK